MSNPDPRYDPENVHEDDHRLSPRAKALRIKKVPKASETVKGWADTLKQMMDQPSTKEGLAKIAALRRKMGTAKKDNYVSSKEVSRMIRKGQRPGRDEDVSDHFSDRKF